MVQEALIRETSSGFTPRMILVSYCLKSIHFVEEGSPQTLYLISPPSACSSIASQSLGTTVVASAVIRRDDKGVAVTVTPTWCALVDNGIFNM